jgi:hypothetical protein
LPGSPKCREASADAAGCSDRNLQTHPVARCPGPPRNQRALLLGSERRRTRRGPRHSTHGIGRRGAHTPEATNAHRGSDGPDQQQSFHHVKPCLHSFTSRVAALVAGATPMAVGARQGFGSFGIRFLISTAKRSAPRRVRSPHQLCARNGEMESGVSLHFVC